LSLLACVESFTLTLRERWPKGVFGEAHIATRTAQPFITAEAFFYFADDAGDGPHCLAVAHLAAGSLRPGHRNGPLTVTVMVLRAGGRLDQGEA
jgi:hypothetical protein